MEMGLWLNIQTVGRIVIIALLYTENTMCDIVRDRADESFEL